MNGQSAHESVRHIAVVIPTWNRRAVAMQAIDGVLAQDADNIALHLIIVDNASSDDTFSQLWKRFPDADLITNRSLSSHRIDLVIQRSRTPHQPSGNLASITLARNTANLGGSGGFNTGMAIARDILFKGSSPFALWLLDDDASPPPDALRHLIAALDSDSTIGLAGSRSIDPRDRTTTLETTVYFLPTTGHLDNAPEPTDPRLPHYQRWVAMTGGSTGNHSYSGLIDTDVCAACSVLARWTAFLNVGLWDHRFFIYEDDVDFSLRFAAAGYRVVCALDARVYHLTWHQKLTPSLIAQRLYYVQRNRTWLLSRHPDPRARGTVKTWLHTTLHHGITAALHRRAIHGQMLLSSVESVLDNTGGKLSPWPGAPIPLARAAQDAGLLAPHCRVAAICDRPGFTVASRILRDQIITLRSGNSTGLTWIDCVRSDLAEPPQTPTPTSSAAVPRLTYSASLRSKLFRQLPLLLTPPHVVIIFDESGDLPLFRGSTNLHLRAADLTHAWVEHDSPAHRLAALRLWWSLRRRIPTYLRTVSPGRASQPTVTVSAAPWPSPA
jgi:GT2 family glycosyltransferase